MFLKMIDHWPLQEGEGAEPAVGGSIATGAGAPVPEGGVSKPEGEDPAGSDPAGGPAGDDPAGAGDKPADEGGQEKPDEPVVPEKYEFKLPEGLPEDTEATAQFSELAKGLKLTQEQAQSLVDLYAERMKGLVEGQVASWTATRKEWVTAAQTDKEYGGANFDANRAHVARAMKQFGTPELAKALDEFGFGDHPELVRFFYRVGKLVSEPSFHTGSGENAGARTPESVLYPNMK